MKDEITKWLNKSGYPLELFVASELKKRGYITGKSELFVDFETGKNREIDVTGYHHGNLENDNYHCARRIIFECKKSEKPILNLCVDNELESRFHHQAFYGDPEDLPTPDVFAYIEYEKSGVKEKESLIGGFSESTLLGYSLVPAFSKSDQEIFSGLMGLIKASTYYRRLFTKFAGEARGDLTLHLQDRNCFEMHLAVLVVDAPIFDIHLNPSGGVEMMQSKWSILRTQLPWSFNPHDSQEGYCIHIVTKDYIPMFLDSVEKLHNYIYSPQNVEHLLDKRPQIDEKGLKYTLYNLRKKLFNVRDE
ncbi:MAG: hypothetical protein OQJ95_05560 [Kangiella sp.]|nr:hypothetical protein [Kangiella sp.]